MGTMPLCGLKMFHKDGSFMGWVRLSRVGAARVGAGKQGQG